MLTKIVTKIELNETDRDGTSQLEASGTPNDPEVLGEVRRMLLLVRADLTDLCPHF